MKRENEFVRKEQLRFAVGGFMFSVLCLILISAEHKTSFKTQFLFLQAHKGSLLALLLLHVFLYALLSFYKRHPHIEVLSALFMGVIITGLATLSPPEPSAWFLSSFAILSFSYCMHGFDAIHRVHWLSQNRLMEVPSDLLQFAHDHSPVAQETLLPRYTRLKRWVLLVTGLPFLAAPWMGSDRSWSYGTTTAFAGFVFTMLIGLVMTSVFWVIILGPSFKRPLPSDEPHKFSWARLTLATAFMLLWAVLMRVK